MSNNNNLKAIIQSIDSDKMQIKIGEEIKEIKLQLSDLKAILQAKNINIIQYAEKIYNIDHIDEANFGYVTGQQPFNRILTKEILGHIQKYANPTLQNFYKKVSEIPEWENEARISDRVKEVLAFSFVGVLGIQFSKLMAIGKEEYSIVKMQKYTQKCVQLIKRSLDLINFALLSKFWDIRSKELVTLSADQKKELSLYFDASFEPSTQEQFKLLCILHQIFKVNNLDNPITELADISNELESSTSDLGNTCKTLQGLLKKLEKGQFSLMDCFQVENKTAIFFKYFAFLINYRMASIKHIGYDQTRGNDPMYLHRYIALGIDGKANIPNKEKVLYTPNTVHSNSVLLYKGEDHISSINLFPFVIDHNALSFEQGVKICFYNSTGYDEKSLNFLFLEDNKIIPIEKVGILKEDTDIHEFMMNNDLRKILNLDNIITRFQEAKMQILK